MSRPARFSFSFLLVFLLVSVSPRLIATTLSTAYLWGHLHMFMQLKQVICICFGVGGWAVATWTSLMRERVGKDCQLYVLGHSRVGYLIV